MFRTNEQERIRFFRNYADFEVATAPDGMTVTVSGTGAQGTAVAPQSADMIGVLALETGTTAAGLAAVASGASCLRLDSGGRLSGEWKLRSNSALSDGTNTFTLRVGFIDSVAAESTDGVFFRYTHSVNSGKYQAVCRANGVETVVDTGVAYAINTNSVFSIQMSPLGDKAFFFIDDVAVASISTNIPSGSGRETGFGVFLLKTAGTTSVFSYVDYQDVVCVFK